jgi:PPOX class probable F420-dependent enzyme
MARPTTGAIMTFSPTDRVRSRLDKDLVAWLTTVTPDGRPAPRPVWFVWDGSVIIVYSLNNSAKLRHIQTNSHVAVHFNSSAEGSDVVVIFGTAERLADAPLPSQYPGLLNKYAPLIQKMGREPQWYDDNYSAALRITPARAWTIPG